MNRLFNAMVAGISLAALSVPVTAQPSHNNHRGTHVQKRDSRSHAKARRNHQQQQARKQAQRQQQAQQRAYNSGYAAGQRAPTAVQPYGTAYPAPVYNTAPAYNTAAYNNVPVQYWRGDDGRYYCKRKDGTTGLIVGAVAGGVLGNVIAPDGNKLLGSVIGGTLGAVIGKEITKGNVRCQ